MIKEQNVNHKFAQVLKFTSKILYLKMNKSSLNLTETCISVIDVVVNFLYKFFIILSI